MRMQSRENRLKKLISAFLAIVMIAGLMAYLPGGFIQVSAATIDSSGKCGENLTWELNGSTNKLTIRGRGEMYNYTPENSAPWGTYISEVDISPYVTSIGDYAFYGFNYTTSITIPNGVTSIGKYAFAGYSGLTSITIPSSVKSIGYSAFENCLSLTRVNTTNIAAWCEIVFSNSYSNPLSYAHSLYLNSNAVKNLVLPEGITKLNDYVFYGFSGLVSVTIPDDVLSIGAYAFYGCDHLTNVTIPSSVMSIGNSAFEGCSAMAWVNTTDVVSWCGIVFGNYYSNPLNYAHGFYLNSNIVKDLVIPDGVTRINAYAFFGCTGLTSIMIPESVADIGVYAFHYYDYYWGDDPRPLDATLKVYKDSYAQRYAVNNQFEYEVQKRLQRIEVTVQPTKTSYIKGETLDVSGGRITLYYDNGSSEAIAISSSMISGFDSGVVGTQTLTVTYNGRTAFFNVTVVGDAVKGMVITSAPTKTVYQVGETLALNGCKVRITYNGGAVRTARIIDEAGAYKIVFDDNSEQGTITVSGYNRLKNGNQTITISYSGVSASFIIEMNGTAPKGDPDCDGQITVADALVALRVAAKLSESSPEMVACCDTDGDGHITVADALAILRVAAKLAPPFDLIILVRIAVTTLPSKTSYISGEALDITGCKITLYYSDGSSEIVAVSDSMVSGFSSSTTGTKTLTVTYEGKTATFTVTVVAKSLTSITITAKPTKTSYVVGQSLEVTGGKITAYYNDGSSSVVNMTVSMVSGFSSSTAGTKTLTVTYEGKTATFTVTVIAKVLTNIAITTNPTKTSYVVGETLDVTGGKITAYYNDGSSEVINMTASMVSGFNSSTLGTKTLTVTYNGKTATFVIDVIPEDDACGDNLIWTLDEGGNLIISGTGDMWDFDSVAPWMRAGCPEIKNVIISYGATSIGNNAFNDCDGMTSITMPGSVKNIGDWAFRNCVGLTSVTIPDSVASIGEGAFGGVLLTNVTIPDSVMGIGDYAFMGCPNLRSVTIGTGVTSIGDMAFFLSDRVTLYVYSNSYAHQYAVDNNLRYELISQISEGVCGTELTWKLYDNGLLIISGTGPMTDYTNRNAAPWKGKDFSRVIIEVGVTSIGEYAFFECENLTSVTIGDGVRSIGYMACSCTGLTSVTIPYSVTSISNYAFYASTALETITVAENNTVYHSAGNCLIETESKTLITGCKNSAIPVDGSVTSIGKSAFSYCAGLTSVTIPDSVTSIGKSAFSGCTGLTSVTIPDSVTYIGDCAFQSCTGLTSVTIPDSVTSISDLMFNNCIALTSVTIPDSVTSIGTSAFNSCTALTSVTIPNGVTTIGVNAFNSCFSLKSVTIPDSVTSIGDMAFFLSDKVTLYVYSNSYALQYAINKGIRYTIV